MTCFGGGVLTPPPGYHVDYSVIIQFEETNGPKKTITSKVILLRLDTDNRSTGLYFLKLKGFKNGEVFLGQPVYSLNLMFEKNTISYQLNPSKNICKSAKNVL